MPTSLTLLLAALLPTAFVDKIPEHVRDSATISIADARNLLIENQGNRVFFRVRGTIIADKRGQPTHFILLDKTAATDVLCSCDDKWRVGDEIEAVCTAMQPSYHTPTLRSEALEISVLRHREPSAPSSIHLVDLAGHRNDFNLVSIEGVVIDAFGDDINPQWTILMLERDDVQTMVWTRNEDLLQRRVEDLIDTEMRITGVALPDLGSFYRAHGPWVLAYSPDAFKVLKARPPDPFAADGTAPHRQLARGTVVACWHDDSFMLAAESGKRTRVKLMRGAMLPGTGDHVTVAGFLRHNEFCLRIANAVCRVDQPGGGAVESPVDAMAEKILFNDCGERQVDTKLNGFTIRASGTVQEVHAPKTERAAITLTAGRAVFMVMIGKDADVPATGALVEATGACLVEDSVDMDTGAVRTTGFSIALRSPEDLRVLAAPPWWTPARLFLLIALLVLTLLAILIWNAALRKIVVRRSRELAKETIRSTAAALRLEERTRLAVELHDTIAQNLTGASFAVKTAARLAEKNREKMQEQLQIVEHTLKSCRDEIRNCIWDLRTNALDQRDLGKMIRLALNPHVGAATLHVRFNVSRARIPETTLHALICIVRELAINAVRHGGATEIWVAGGIDGHMLAFSVRDNGCGFAPECAPGADRGHFGLQGIRERIRKFNGTMSIDSSPGNETRAVIQLDLRADTGSQPA